MWESLWKEMEMESVVIGSQVSKKDEKNYYSEKVLLKKVICDWLHAKRLHVKESTYANYLHAVERHILPQLAKLRQNRFLLH